MAVVAYEEIWPAWNLAQGQQHTELQAGSDIISQARAYLFRYVRTGPADPVFILSSKVKADEPASKIDLGVGVY